jgi:RNA polymerase sigma-32 factor
MRETDQALSSYIAQVKQIPVLTREEEHELAVKWRDERDNKAGERLVRANLRYVVAIALTYRRYGLRLSDLIAEGNVGVVTALRKFDPDKGTRFVTYAAYWIRAFILNFVIRSWSLVGSGSGPLRSKLFFRLRRERARIANLVSEKDEAMEQLATQLGTTVDKLTPMMQRLESRDVSLDQKAFADSEHTKLDMLESPLAGQDEIFEANEREQLIGGRVKTALSALDTRERFIVERRMLADEELSLAEIGRQLGVSRERARQLEARAKKKLRKSLADLEPANTDAAAKEAAA